MLYAGRGKAAVRLFNRDRKDRQRALAAAIAKTAGEVAWERTRQIQTVLDDRSAREHRTRIDKSADELAESFRRRGEYEERQMVRELRAFERRDRTKALAVTALIGALTALAWGWARSRDAKGKTDSPDGGGGA